MTTLFEVWTRVDSHEFKPSGEGPFASEAEAIDFCEAEVGAGWLIKPVEIVKTGRSMGKSLTANKPAKPSPITAGLINGQFVLLTDDKDYVVADEGVWLSVKRFSVRVVKTDEGICCDIYAAGKEDKGCLGSTWVLDSVLEADDAAT